MRHTTLEKEYDDATYNGAFDSYQYFIKGRIDGKRFVEKISELGLTIPEFMDIVNDYYKTMSNPNSFTMHQEKEQFIYAAFMRFLDNEINYDDFYALLAGIKHTEWIRPENSRLISNINRFCKDYKAFARTKHFENSLEAKVSRSPFFENLFTNYRELSEGKITPEEYIKRREATKVPINDIRNILLRAAKYITNESEEDLIAYDNEFIYNMFMDFYDRKIPFKVLWETIYCFRTGFSGSTINFHKGFLKAFSAYAKKEKGIEDLEKYVASKPLFEECHRSYFESEGKDANNTPFALKIFEEGIDKMSYGEIAKAYAKTVKNQSSVDLSANSFFSNKYGKVLSKIDECNSKQTIYELLSEYAEYTSKGVSVGNRNLYLLRGYVYNYVKFKYGKKDDFKQRVEILTQKINDVKEAHNKKKKAQLNKEKNYLIIQKYKEMIPEARTVIDRFMSEYNGNSIKDFCFKFDISESTFSSSVSAVKAIDPDLYKRYCEVLNQRRGNKQVYLKGEVEKIMNLMLNGVDDELFGVTREFDAVDYFSNTELEPAMFYTLVLGTHNEKYVVAIKKFFAKYAGMGAKRTNDPDTIKGDGISSGAAFLRSYDKQEIIDELKEKNVPINEATFLSIVSRKRLMNKLINEEMERLSSPKM